MIFINQGMYRRRKRLEIKKKVESQAGPMSMVKDVFFFFSACTVSEKKRKEKEGAQDSLSKLYNLSNFFSVECNF
jgi:hypothetical protein